MRCPRFGPAVLPVAALALLAGCAGDFPADTDGTLERVRSQKVLRVGASHHPPQVVQPAQADAGPSGAEVDLVDAYARSLGATIDWTVGSEATLIDGLDSGELDLAIAGFEATTPWSADAGLTRPYARDSDDRGRRIERVIATPAGENALLGDLERWLDTHAGDPP